MKVIRKCSSNTTISDKALVDLGFKNSFNTMAIRNTNGY